MPTEYPPPPNWPLLPLHKSQWPHFERAGYDMRMFWLVKPIPRMGEPVTIWNAAIEAAALIVEPHPHVDEERECKDVARAVRTLKI